MKNLQLYPLPRVCVVLALGILFGDFLSPDVPAWIALACASVCIGVAIGLKRHHSSILILCATFFIGAWLIGARLEALHDGFRMDKHSFQGIIASQPVKRGKVMTFDLWAISNGKAIKLRGFALHDSLSGKDKALALGQGITALARITPFENKHPASSFNYARWAQVHGYAGQAFLATDSWMPSIVSLASLSWIQRTRLAALQWREKMIQAMPRTPEGASARSIIAAMALGDKGTLSQETKELYSTTGASHVLALSGLHLSILFSILLLVFPRRKMRVASQTLLLLTVWAYAFLTGLSPSIVRSATMLSLYGLMALGHRQALSLNTLAFAAIVILIASPMSLWDVGFQMSFLSVTSIILSLQWMGLPVRRKAMTILFVIPIAAQLATFPLVMYYFGRFPCLFLLSNLIVIPMAYIVLYGTMAWVVLLPFPSISTPVFQAIEHVVDWGNTALSAIAALPYSSISDIHVSPWQVCFIYLLIGCIVSIIHRLAKGHEQARFLHLSDKR